MGEAITAIAPPATPASPESISGFEREASSVESKIEQGTCHLKSAAES